MKTSEFIFIVLSALLASCTSLSAKEVTSTEPTIVANTQKPIVVDHLEVNKPVTCYEPYGYDNEPIPVVTGLERSTPLDIISRELFIERLEMSSLWKEVSYSNHFKRNFSFSDINGFLSIDGDDPKPKQLQEITYIPFDLNKRKAYGHQLLDQEKFAMTEIINLVIDDHDKATEILDQLYQQYLVKVKNNDVLNDGETLHTYVRYDDKLFELWGLSRDTHSIEACNFNMLTTLTIS